MASELLVEKRSATLAELKLLGGDTLKHIPVGFETYGSLNENRDNAILVAHYFSGTSHAAGRYRRDDPQPGYWDAIIGPGKAVDTDTYFVISVDSLANLNAFDKNVVTLGPASPDPATGKPYGLRFPAVAIADFVRMQKALLDSLGISRLHAVMGPSMGGLQTFEWAASFPEMVGRIIPVIAAPNFGAWVTAWLSMWAQPIKLDPAWRGGDYYDAEPPRAGLEAALRLIMLGALDSEWADKVGRALAEGGVASDIASDPYAIEQILTEGAREKLATIDANHLLYMVRANQTYVPGAGAGARDADEGLSRIIAPALVIYAPNDQIFRAEWVEDAARKLGKGAETFKIDGPYGHYNGILRIADASERIAAFLAAK
jgi:homoserine O-acetyltransferase